MTNRHGGPSLSFSIFLYSHYCSEFLTISPRKKRMHSAVPIDHTSNGCRSCVANASDQTRRPARKKKKKKPDEQKARPTARVSHHNKSSAKRQLCKWARLAALLEQFAVNWKMFCAQHGCTWITHSVVQYCAGFIQEEEAFLQCFDVLYFNFCPKAEGIYL